MDDGKGRKLTGAAVSLIGQTRRASEAVGSGARQTGYWGVSPIVAVTAKTIVIEFHSGRRQSIRLDTGEGVRGGDVVTALHPDGVAKLG